MPQYRIFPTDQSSSPGIAVTDASALLMLVGRLECKEADVERDGEYCFTLSLGGNGIWTIFQREGLGQNEAVPPFG